MKGPLSYRIGLFLISVCLVSASCSPKLSRVVAREGDRKVKIQEIQILPTPEKTGVFIVGEEPMVYTAFHLSHPDRLVVDIVGVELGQFVSPIPIENGPIRVIIPKMTEGGRVARLEMELAKDVQTSVRPEGVLLSVEASFSPESLLSSTNQLKEATPSITQEKILDPAVSTPDSVIVADIPLERESSKPAEIISEIRFDRKEGLQLVLVSDGALSPRPFYLDMYRLVMDFPTVRLAKKMAAVAANDRAVKQVRIGEHPDKVRLVIDLLSPVEYFLKQSGNELRISLKEVAIERIEDRIRTDVALERKAAPPVAVATPVVERAEPVSTSKYVGRRISLDFQDAEIADIIRLIAEVSGLNIVLGEEVKGLMTLKLSNVPWDHALETILKINILGQQRDGNIIVISTLASIAQRQEEEAKAKDTGMRAEDRETKIIYLNYTEAETLAESFKKLLSPRGDITVDKRTNTMIVKDIPSSIEEVSKMAKLLDTRTPQVSIEARIVQVSPKFTQNLGVQWGASQRGVVGNNLIRLGSHASAPGGSGLPFTTLGNPDPGFAVNVPASTNFGGIGFTFGRFTDSPFTLDLRLSAGETQGLTKIVSTPKITVLDNLEAKIEQGESIPYETVSDKGTQTIFIDAGLTLLVKPHISTDGGIMMKVTVKKNSAGENRSKAGPSIIKKEATTNVLVLDGETVAIGGIQETVDTESTIGIPFFMNIPVIGHLFKNKSKAKENSELLVFLTPKIIR
ncbi:MAG: type IV pilus secretin PilQ [Nitrospirota bacterium]